MIPNLPRDMPCQLCISFTAQSALGVRRKIQKKPVGPQTP